MIRARHLLALRTLVALALLGLLTACPKKTADPELEAARRAIEDAQAKKAKDCAKETFLAAESAIAEAKRLADGGDVEGAKRKAAEAKTLADQASAASRPGCDQPAVTQDDDDDDIRPVSRGMEDAGRDMKLEAALETVYFDYNDAAIREDSKAVLSKVANIMRKEPGTRIEVEGHCDVRGSTEYNLHLGERRARSVQKYLVTQGVKADQIDIISYGEERPVDLGFDESAHSRNRRAELKKR